MSEILMSRFKLAGELDNLVARVSLKERTEVTNITLYLKNLRFRCQRCASFCCRLGGPPLTREDINRIRKAGYRPDEFSDPTQPNRFELPRAAQGVMRARQDGSCIFLGINSRGGEGGCSIYDYRPALCRLYPFYIEMTDSQSFLLKVIPCCRGLNDPNGEPVNEEFIRRHLYQAVIDLLATDSRQNPPKYMGDDEG